MENRHIPVILDDIESIDIDEQKDLNLARAVLYNELHKDYVTTVH